MAATNGNSNGSAWRPWLDRLLVAALGLVAALVVALWGMTRSTVASQGEQLDTLRTSNDASHLAIMQQIQQQQRSLEGELSAVRLETVRELRQLDQSLSGVGKQVTRLEALLGPSGHRSTP